MKRNTTEEYLVLLSIKELGLGNVEEVKEYLEKEKETTPSIRVPENISLILERWKARNLLAVQYCDDNIMRYKMAKIPAPFQSVSMVNVKRMKGKDMQTAIEQVEKDFPDSSEPITPVRGSIGSYAAGTVGVIIETLDPVAGGSPSSNGENLFRVHRKADGTPYITPAMWKGWFRDNGRLIEWNPNAKAWIAYSDGIPIGEPKIEMGQAPIVVQQRGAGIAKYETFAVGTIFKAIFRFPTRGIGILSIKDVEKLFKMCEVAPRRGLGANPFYFGGKFKVLDMKQVPETATLDDIKLIEMKPLAA